MYRIEVVGIPAQQGSKTPIHRGGKTWMVEDAKMGTKTKLTNWRQDVMYAVRDYMNKHNIVKPLDEPVEVRITFRFPLPGDQYRTMHSTKPDADKLLRSTFDAMIAAGLIVDDARITSGRWHKHYAHPPMTPGATIQVQPLGATESALRESLKAAAKAARRDATT